MTYRSEADPRGCILGVGSGLTCLFLWEGIAFAGFGYVALTERGPGVTNTD
jgi:hypothetical protein